MCEKFPFSGAALFQNVKIIFVFDNVALEFPQELVEQHLRLVRRDQFVKDAAPADPAGHERKEEV